MTKAELKKDLWLALLWGLIFAIGFWFYGDYRAKKLFEYMESPEFQSQIW